MPLYGRRVILQVGQPNAEGLSWEGLRVSFRVQKNLGKNANKAAIAAYNLAPQSVARFQEPGAVVRLFAGHSIPRLIASGSPVKDGVQVERQGTERVLSLEIQDGGRQLVTSRLNLTFATETSAEQVFRTVADQLGVPLGATPELADVRLTQGITLTGPTRDVLGRLGDMAGLDLTIRDGALDAIARDGDAGDSAVVLSTANGNLLRVVRKDRGIEAVAILDARIQPGRRFVVESTVDTSLSGIYKARDVEYSGDTHDNDFTMTITGRPPPPAPVIDKDLEKLKAGIRKDGRMFETLAAALPVAKRFIAQKISAFVVQFSANEFGVVSESTARQLARRGFRVFTSNGTEI